MHPTIRTLVEKAVAFVAAGLLMIGAASSAGAQSTLQLNGETSLTLPPGAGIIVTAKLKPLALGGIVYDEFAGPTDFFGELVPVAFSSSMGVLAGPMTVPASGTILLSTAVPADAALLGKTFYLVGFALDNADPNGIAFTNGASVKVEKLTSAGIDQAAFLGSQVVLDGSANASNNGALAPGEILTWQVLSRPAGSVAPLLNNFSMFPVIVPDVAGKYQFKATLLKNGVAQTSDTTELTAFSIAGVSPAEGSIVAGSSFWIYGTATPADQYLAFAIDGNVISLTPTGLFIGPLYTFDPGSPARSYTIQAVDLNGAIATKRVTVLHGSAAPTASSLSQAVRANITNAGFQKVSNLVLAQLNALDLNAAIVNSVPAMQVADFFIGVAYAKPSSATHGPYTVSMTPTANDVDAKITISDLHINMNFWGTLFTVPWSTTGYIRADLVTLTSNATFPIQNGKLTVALSPAQIAISGFSYDVSNIPFDIDQAFTGTVYDAALSALQSAVDPLLESVLSSGFEVDLTHVGFELLGKSLDLNIPFETVSYSTQGISATASGFVTNLSPSTGPALPNYISGAGALANFGTTTPAGASYDVGTGTRTDALNLFLARLTQAGVFTTNLLNISSAFGLPLGSAPLTANDLASILPSAGFELLPPGQIINIVFSPKVAPIAKVLTSGPANAHLDFPGVRVDFLTKPFLGSTEVPILSLMLDLRADLTTGFNGSALNLAVSTIDVNATLLSGLPSVDLISLGSGIQQVGSVLGSALAGALGEFTLPTFDFNGVVISPISVGPFGGSSGLAAWTQFN
ncbi:MAG: hypothetical protein ACKVS6_13250 [Planctomycetota bacterium]